MLEEKIERLTAEVIKLREAYEKGGKAAGGAAAGGAADKAKPAADKPKAAAPKKSKYTADQIKAAVIKVKDEVGQDEAKTIIADAGASGLAELITMTDKFDDVMAACEEQLNGGGREPEDDLDGL